MKYCAARFATKAIAYAYDNLNQLTSVSNYGNLGLKDVYQYDSRGNITRKDCYNASSNALNGYSLYQYDTARLDQLSNYTLYDSAGAVVSTRDYTYARLHLRRYRDKSILNSARTGSINLIYSGIRKR